jgi:hypothetical protein
MGMREQVSTRPVDCSDRSSSSCNLAGFRTLVRRNRGVTTSWIQSAVFSNLHQLNHDPHVAFEDKFVDTQEHVECDRHVELGRSSTQRSADCERNIGTCYNGPRLLFSEKGKQRWRT